MMLQHGYGAVVGTFASFTREDPSHFGHWYHGKLRLSTPAGEYEAALDVDTPTGSGVSYRLVDGLTSADLRHLTALPDGFTPLARTPDSGALDYVRSAVLQDRWVFSAARSWLVSRRSGGRSNDQTSSDELWAPTRVDSLLGWLGRWPWLSWLRWRSFAWVPSNGDNALDVLEPLVRAAARIYVLGEPYTEGLGVHNVHMNQGDPPGDHQSDDGSWQDGAVVTQAADGSLTCWQVKFNAQSLATDDAGLPV